MHRFFKVVFFALVVRPLVLVGLGLNVVNRRLLPGVGPAVIAANHNSHLDALVLMSLYPLSKVHLVRPVAAADYFLAHRLRAWFSLNVVGIIPIDRSGGTEIDRLFDGCREALDRGEILILFPEGSRGDPEKMGRLHKGIGYLLRGREQTGITPVVMHGLGRALPRGEALFVPFNCDVVIGQPLYSTGKSSQLTRQLSAAYDELFKHCLTRRTEDAPTAASSSDE
ncbi:MAG: lysophospholipid acyltransferase family protein [Pirellulales bacterium]